MQRKRAKFVGALFSLVAAVALAVPASSQDPARMEEIVTAQIDRTGFMGTVLVARGDEVLFSEGYGSANLEWDIPNNPNTKFRLGSVTKQFTAASILLLEERGLLSVDDLVSEHLDDAPEAWSEVTIFHVLTHSAGIPNFTSFPEYRETKYRPSPVAQIVERFIDRELDFEPGAEMRYSNSGYVLLGHLIEVVSGRSYEEFLEENIFEPLAMNDSGYDSNSEVIPNRAAGYRRTPSGPVNADFVHMSIPHGAGALYSTTEDLLRWTSGLFGGGLLSAESLERMTTPYLNDYAFGLRVTEEDGGRTQVLHGGGIEGFNTVLSYYPDTEVTVAVLANVAGSQPGPIAANLGNYVHGEELVLTSERVEIELGADLLADYVGTYELSPQARMMVTLADGRLITQMSGQSKVPIFAESETSFFVRVVDAQIDFVRDDRGEVVHLVLHQGGRDVTAPRTSTEVAVRREIALAAEVLAEYAGTYELRPGFDLVVSADGEQLMAQATGQGAFSIFAESEDQFFARVVDIQIEFVRDGDNRHVTGLVLQQGPVRTEATRKN